MSDIAIRVENLGKQYRIGSPHGAYRYKSLRESLTGAFTAPFRGLTNSRFAIRNSQSEMIWALRGVSFEIQQGEVVGVIGRNGAGKSTLLKILSRITEPTEGQATVRGHVGSLLEVGTGFHPELTGRENILLSGAVLGMRRREIESKLDEIVAFAETDKFVDTPVKHYSSGMYMRLAFAVAAHLEPDILVIDEVLAVGDAAFQKKCLGRMQDVAQQGRTVLFVSHNMPAITRLCARATLLDDGRLIKDGRAGDVVAAYTMGINDGSALRQWPRDTAPGSDGVRLLSASVVRADGTPVAVASVEDQLELQIRYHVAEPELRFRCAATFFTQGVCAFGSVEPTEAERLGPADYCSSVTIPPNLLAEGEYSVSISIFSSRGAKKRFAAARDAVVFLMTDPMTGTSARGDYAQKLVGVVRPALAWHLTAEDRAQDRGRKIS